MTGLFGTGEVDIRSSQDELWDKMMCFFGTGKVDIGTSQDEL